MIRFATAADADLLAELGARTFLETYADYNRPDDMAAYLSAHFTPGRLAEELADEDAMCLIAEVDGAAVGYATLRASDVPVCVGGEKPVELARLYVAKEWLSRGVGAALMRACISQAQQKGFQSIWLGVWQRNERAYAFYRKWGFQVVGEHVFQLGSDPQNDWIVERAL
jgi:ribosomal protein S18 acetylase RimI-like enzyme